MLRTRFPDLTQRESEVLWEAVKPLEAVADEWRLYFNDELRHHLKLAAFFDREAGP
jgi:hypothetical protein